MKNVIIVLLATCCTTCIDSSARESLEDEAPGQALEYQAPEVFRELSLERLPAAEDLVRDLLKDPFADGAREALERIYHDAGYRAVASFFRATADLLDQRPIAYERPDRSVAWLYPHEESRASRDADLAFQADGLVREWRYREAVELAEESLRKHGPSPILISAWAHAVLNRAAVETSPVGIADLERAWRFYLLCIEELLSPPIGFGGRSTAWSMLGLYLHALGDPVSAYVATEIALQAVGEEPAHIQEMVSKSEPELRDRLERLAEEINAGRRKD